MRVIYIDTSNIYHFLFSFLTPVAWLAILTPLFSRSSANWPSIFGLVLLLSILLILGKEAFDAEIALNDLVSDALGFFLGLASISYRRVLHAQALSRTGAGEIDGRHVSLRDTMALVERLERRAAEFFLQAGSRVSDDVSAVLCRVLARQAMHRAGRIRLLRSGWAPRPEPEGLADAVERAFQADGLFALAVPGEASPRGVLAVALEQERRKLRLLLRLGEHFADDWRFVKMEKVTNEVRRVVANLEKVQAA